MPDVELARLPLPPRPRLPGVGRGYDAHIVSWAWESGHEGRLLGVSSSGDDISWIAIEAYGTFDSGTHPTQMREQYDWWEAFMAETNTDAPEGVTAGWQTHGATVLMDTLLNLVVSGVYATVLSCGLALCVLVVGTGDIWVGVLAFFCVLAVVFAVLGTSVMGGAPMGIVESVAIGILVGLSSTLWCTSVWRSSRAPHLSRRERVGEALGLVGSPILSGALTTLIAASTLFAPRIVLFSVFGRFLLVISAFSVLSALVYFPMLLMWLGPTAGCTEPSSWWRKVRGGDKVAAKEAPVAEGVKVESDLETAAAAAATETRGAAAGGDGVAGRLWRWTPPKWAVGAIAALLLSIYVAAAVTTYVTLDQTTTFEPVCTAGGGATEFKLNLTFSPFEVPSDVTDSYVCEAMELPDDGCAYHVTEFNPLETTPYVHHMILFGVIQELRPKCTVACFDMPGQVTILYAWAVGGDKMRLPPNVGLRVGKGTSHELSTLQMHYNNPLGVAGAVDSSGVELTLTSELREHDMSMVMSGVPTNDLVRIPPGQTRFIIEASVELRLAAPAKTFAVGLHAHEAGIRIEAWLVREGVVVASLGVENPYNFQNQTSTSSPRRSSPPRRPRASGASTIRPRGRAALGRRRARRRCASTSWRCTRRRRWRRWRCSRVRSPSMSPTAWRRSACDRWRSGPPRCRPRNLATGDSSGGATTPGSVLACSLVLMPGLTLEWVVDGAKMVGRLTLETAGAWPRWASRALAAT